MHCKTSLSEMAIDLSSLVRIMNGYKEDHPTVDSTSGKSTPLITRDLLGGGGYRAIESTELDLDLQVPTGWEKRLDLKSGKVFLQRCDSQNKHQRNESLSKLQDLNNVSLSHKHTLNLFDEPCLDLQLVSSSSRASLSSSTKYQSVCTLDKVRSALERAERETNKKRSVSFSKSSSPVLSNSSSSVREMEMETEYEEKSSSSYAAGCPNCLLYVLISRNNPTCPRCRTFVPSPVAVKKPRIDLNIPI